MKQRTKRIKCSFELDRYPYNRPELEGYDIGCQFSSSQNELIEVDNQHWCLFHLPQKNKLNWNDEKISQFNKMIFDYINHLKDTSKIIDFSGVVFPGDIDFSSIGNTLPGALFIKCVFMKDVRINGITFQDIVMFDEAKCLDQALLWGNEYAKDAHFDSSDLGHNIHFGESVFHKNAYFQAAKFASNAWLSNIHFCGRAWFQSAEFNGIAYFENCEFDGEADFSGPLSGKGGHELTFPTISFKGSRFSDRANFSNRKFNNSTNFSDVVFRVAPEFHESELHQDTSFVGAKFLDIGKTKRTVIHEVYPHPVDSARAYRTLKLAMEKVRDLDGQALFFSLEQKSIRTNPKTPIGLKIISWIYQKSCNYGQDSIRPLVLMFFAFILFSAIYYGINLLTSTTPILMDSIVLFSLQQVFRPFSSLSQDNIPLSLNLAGVLHSLINLTLDTFFVIAVRRKFQLS